MTDDHTSKQPSPDASLVPHSAFHVIHCCEDATLSVLVITIASSIAAKTSHSLLALSVWMMKQIAATHCAFSCDSMESVKSFSHLQNSLENCSTGLLKCPTCDATAKVLDDHAHCSILDCVGHLLAFGMGVCEVPTFDCNLSPPNSKQGCALDTRRLRHIRDFGSSVEQNSEAELLTSSFSLWGDDGNPLVSTVKMNNKGVSMWVLQATFLGDGTNRISTESEGDKRQVSESVCALFKEPLPRAISPRTGFVPPGQEWRSNDKSIRQAQWLAGVALSQPPPQRRGVNAECDVDFALGTSGNMALLKGAAVIELKDWLQLGETVRRWPHKWTVVSNGIRGSGAVGGMLGQHNCALQNPAAELRVKKCDVEFAPRTTSQNQSADAKDAQDVHLGRRRNAENSDSVLVSNFDWRHREVTDMAGLPP